MTSDMGSNMFNGYWENTMIANATIESPVLLNIDENSHQGQESQTGGGDSYSGLHNFSREYMKYHGYIAAVVCVWGIAANLANIIVLTRKNMVSTTNMILTWLAVADLLTMLSYLPVSIHFYILKDPKLDFPSSTYINWIQFMLFHINFTVLCHTIAIWLTIALAIFRYLFICYPTRGADLCNMYRAKLSIIAIYISTAIICIPNYLATTYQKHQYIESHNDFNITTQNVTTTIFSFDYYLLGDSAYMTSLLSNMNYWIQAGLIKLIPCGLLTVLTVLLIIAMHQANKRRMKLKSQGNKDESDRSREQNRTTAMLLAVVGLFLLTELPQGILTLCSIFIPNFFSNVYWPLGDVLDIMALLNNSINFVLYCSMSRQFRQTFVNTFCPSKAQREGWTKVKAITSTPNGDTKTSNV